MNTASISIRKYSAGTLMAATLGVGLLVGIPVWAQSGTHRVASMDLLASDSNSTRSFLLSPSGQFVLFKTLRDEYFSPAREWKDSKLASLVGADEPDGPARFWRWMSDSEFGQLAFSPADGRLIAPATLNGKPWIAGADLGKQGSAAALYEVPKDFWGMRALAWSPDEAGVYLVLSYRLQRPRARPEDDNPVTENINVSLRVSARYLAKQNIEWVTPAYAGAVGRSTRDFFVYYDFGSRQLHRVFTGNDVRDIVFSPDGRHVLVSQMKGLSKGGTPVTGYDVYVVALPRVGELPRIDLAKAKEAERNAGWFDHAGHPIRPAIRDLSPADAGGVAFYYPTWSPDSTRIAFLGATARSTQDVWLYDVAKSTVVNLTAGEKVAAAVAGSSWRLIREPNAPEPDLGASKPSWSEDGRELWVTTNRGQLWQLAIGQESSPIDITPPEGPGIASIVERAGSPGVVVARGSRILVQTTDAQKMTDGLAWLDPVERRLDPVYAGRGLIHKAVALRKGDAVFFNETAPEGTAQFLSASLTDQKPVQQLSAFESALEGDAWPQKRILRFETGGGEVGYAYLQLPPGEGSAQPPPLVVTPSAWQTQLWPWRLWGRDIISPLGEPTEQWTDHGYAVLSFDIPEHRSAGSFSDPLAMAAAACEAATRAAIATGLIDSNKMALYGESGRAAYFVQGLIGRLDLFRAAVSVGGTGDLVSYALLVGPESVRGGYRMGVDFLEDPKRYLDSSPIAGFRTARTPLLILDQANGRSSSPFADESFAALAPTGTAVVRAQYNKSPGDDLQKRTLAWLNEHLNGGPAVSGLANLPDASSVTKP